MTTTKVACAECGEPLGYLSAGVLAIKQQVVIFCSVSCAMTWGYERNR